MIDHYNDGIASVANFSVMRAIFISVHDITSRATRSSIDCSILETDFIIGTIGDVAADYLTVVLGS